MKHSQNVFTVEMIMETKRMVCKVKRSNTKSRLPELMPSIWIGLLFPSLLPAWTVIGLLIQHPWRTLAQSREEGIQEEGITLDRSERIFTEILEDWTGSGIPREYRKVRTVLLLSGTRKIRGGEERMREVGNEGERNSLSGKSPSTISGFFSCLLHDYSGQTCLTLTCYLPFNYNINILNK